MGEPQPGNQEPGEIAKSAFSGSALDEAKQALGGSSGPAGVEESVQRLPKEEDRLAAEALEELTASPMGSGRAGFLGRGQGTKEIARAFFGSGRQGAEKAFEVAKNITENINQELKNKFRSISAADKLKFRNAALRGAYIGAAGILLAGGVIFGGPYVEDAGKSILQGVGEVAHGAKGIGEEIGNKVQEVGGNVQKLRSYPQIPEDVVTTPSQDIVQPTSTGEIIPKEMQVSVTPSQDTRPLLSSMEDDIGDEVGSE